MSSNECPFHEPANTAHMQIVLNAVTAGKVFEFRLRIMQIAACGTILMVSGWYIGMAFTFSTKNGEDSKFLWSFR